MEGDWKEELDQLVQRTDGSKLTYLFDAVSEKWTKQLEDEGRAAQNRANICSGNTKSAERHSSGFEGIVEEGIELPPGINGFCKKRKQFIKYFDLNDGPATTKKVGNYTLRLSSCGFWFMDDAESTKFNNEHNQKSLVKKERKPNSKPKSKTAGVQAETQAEAQAETQAETQAEAQVEADMKDPA